MDVSRYPSPSVLPMISPSPALPGLLEIDLPPCEGPQKIVIERVPLPRPSPASVLEVGVMLPIDDEAAYQIRYLRAAEAPRAEEA